MPSGLMVEGPGTTPGQGGTLPGEVRQFYSNRLLIAAKPRLAHVQFCDDQPIPKHYGTTINMRRFELLSTNTTALTEGVTPTGTQLTMSTVAVTLAQYGSFVTLSDWFDMTAIDDILVEANDKLGFMAGQTLDQIARDFMTLGTNVLYAGGEVSRAALATGDKYTAVEIKKSVRTLENAAVIPYDDQSYVAIISPSTKYDIMSIAEWLAVKEYSDREDLYRGEVGELYGIRYVATSLAKVYTAAGASGQDVHATLTFGRNAFAKSEISGENLEMIVKPLDSGGVENALNQRGSSGWKAPFGGTIQNQTYVVRVEASVSS